MGLCEGEVCFFVGCNLVDEGMIGRREGLGHEHEPDPRGAAWLDFTSRQREGGDVWGI